MNYCLKLHLIAFALLIYGFTALTTVPTFQITDKYIETGTYTVNTLGYYYGNSSWVGVGQSTFTITFIRNQSSSQTQVSFQQVSFQITSSYLLNISINACGNTSSSMTVCLLSSNLDNLYTLRVRYIALSPIFNKITLYTLNANPSATTFINSTTPYLTTASLSSTNITGTLRVFLAFIGFNVAAFDNNLQLDLKASGTFLSSTSLQLKIETTLINNIAFFGASFAYVGYSEEAVADWPFPAAQLNYLVFSGGGHSNAVFFDFNNIVRDFNTFWGLFRLNINNQANMHFTSDISSTPMSNIMGKSNFTFNNLDFEVLIFKFKQCDPATPYYMRSTDICYDICPARYYQDDNQYSCEPCIYSDCYKCIANGSCTACNATVQYRTLNPTTSRCDFITGYFSGGGGSVSSCNSNCYACSLSATNCTSCRSGTYLDSSNTCSPCIANCQSCSTGTSCSLCISYYALDNTNTSCVSTINCSTVSNCQTCNTASGCTQCDLGYSPTNIVTCTAVCGDGIKLSFEACDDNNNVAGDGCSSNCTIEPGYYCNGSDGNLSICDKCSLHCSSCTAVNSCQLCDNPYLLNSTTTSCVPNCSLITQCLTCHEPIGANYTVCDTCGYGYQPINHTCSPVCGDSILVAPQQCDDGNTTDGDGCSASCRFQDNSVCTVVNNKSNCSFCLAKSYADADHLFCLPCANYDCQTCNSSGMCLTCNATANRILNSTINRCTAMDGFYDDGANQLAANCSIDCATCKGGGSDSCLSCSTNRILINNNCILCSSVAGTGCEACIIANSSFVCVSCNSTIINGTCISQSSLPSIAMDLPTDPLCNILLTVVIPLLLALLFLCCLCLILMWRRRRSEQNKVNEQPKDGGSVKMEDLIMNKKRVQGKAQDTEGNELSIDEFKDIGNIKEYVDKQKSVLNKRYDNKSQQSREQKKSNDGQSRGDAY